MSNTVNEESIPARRQSGWERMGIVIMILAVAGFMGAFGYGYYELSNVNVALARTMASVEQRSSETQQSVSTLHQTVSALEDDVAKSQHLAAEQEKLVTEWRNAQKGDLDKWRIAEAQYLTKIANDHLVFTHDTGMAITLLQRADATLQSVQNADVLEIRKAIAADVTTLQSAPQIDTTSLYLHINALNAQMEQLPLLADTLNSTTSNTSIDIPADAPWWRAGLLRSWQVINKFIVVRNMNASGVPLIFPEEKTYLYQNLHAQMQNAMWAVLYRYNDVYQASLANTIAWIQKYFVLDAPETKTILQNLQELQQMDIKPVVASLDTTLQLFDMAAAQTTSQETH